MIDGQNDVNWILSPSGNLVKYIAEETIHASVLHRAIVNLSGMEFFIKIARQKYIAEGVDDKNLKFLQSQSKFLAEKAKELIDTKFHSINSHALIGVWCALETAVEDTIILILINDSSSLEVIRNCEFKIKQNNLLSNEVSEKDARKIYSLLERQARQGRSVGEGYCKLLSIFEIEVNLKPLTIKKLAEVNAVRNCILHRGGIIDDKAIDESDDLSEFYDKKLILDNNLYLKYFDAISDFSREFSSSILKSKYIKTNNSQDK